MSTLTDRDDFDSIRYQFKIVLLGDGGSGKTCIINRYCFSDFIDTKLTIGLSFNSYSILAKENGKKFRIGLSLWDFGGQRRYRPLLPQFIQGCNAAIFVFDLLSFHTLNNLILEWLPLLKENSNGVPSILVGTKADLLENPDTILDGESLKDFKNKLGIKEYLITSSKTGQNIENIFKKLIYEILKEPPFDKRKIELL